MSKKRKKKKNPETAEQPVQQTPEGELDYLFSVGMDDDDDDAQPDLSEAVGRAFDAAEQEDETPEQADETPEQADETPEQVTAAQVDRPTKHYPERLAAPTPEERKKRREIRIMAVMIVIAVVMSLAAAAAVFIARWSVKPTLPPVSGADPLPSASAAPSPGQPGQSQPPEEEPVQVDETNRPKVSGDRRSEEIYTILVAGTDKISSSTDTIMLVTYDVANQQATVMSIPRDLIVNVRNGNSRNYTRVNTVYAIYGKDESGMDGLTEEVADLVGFVPDFRVFIDWELVGEMVNAIGGVWYDVPYRMKYDDPEQDLHIDQQPGYRKLNGSDAMQVVRWRKNNPGVSGGGNGSDINRLEVQHGFLKAVLKQTLQITNITRIGELAELFGERVTSDLKVENLFYFAQRAIFGGLRVDDVEFLTMPYYGYSAYVYPNQQELLELINDKLNPYSTQVTVNELDLISVNSDGSLRSTSGVLANPSWGYAPARQTTGQEEAVPDPPKEDTPASPAPSESAPAVGPDPAVSEGPAPAETGGPEPSAPVETVEPVEPETPTEPAPPAEPSAPEEPEPPAETDAPTEPTPPAEPSPDAHAPTEPSAPPEAGTGE